LAFPPIAAWRNSLLASVSVDDVRDVLNLNSGDIPDSKIEKMIKRAEVALELELGKEIVIQIAQKPKKKP